MLRGQSGNRYGAVLVGMLAAFSSGCAVAAGPPARVADAAVAIVTDVDGSASLQRAGRTHAVVALELLERADQIRLAAGAHVEVVFFGGRGRVFSLSGPGRFALRSDEAVGLDAHAQISVRDLAPAWRTLQIRPGPVGRASVALRGASGERLEVQSPAGAQLAAALVQLRWDPPYGRHPESWAYVVRVIDSGGGLVFSISTRATSVPLPESVPWVREQEYLWTVEASAEDGRHARVATEFCIVDTATEQRIAGLRWSLEQTHKSRPGDGATAEEVLLATELAQSGLRNEADRQWRVLALRRPALAYLAPTEP